MSTLRSYHGFSLIELMVVIAIVALLAAVAVPSYKSYSLRAKVSNAMPTIKAMANAAAIQYNNTGSFPTNLVWGGKTYTGGNIVAVNIGNVVNLRYDTATVNGVNMIRIQANLSDLNGIPGYVAPPQTDVSSAGMIRYIMYDKGNNILSSVCGEWFSDTAATEDIPKTYQPSNCVCNIANLWTYGTMTWTAC